MHFVNNFHFQPFLGKDDLLGFLVIWGFGDHHFEARGTTFGVQGYAATLAAVP